MRPPLALAALACLALALAACSSEPPKPQTPSALKVSGVITVTPSNYPNVWPGEANTPCATTDGFSDIAPGTQVVITDAASKTLALGRLEVGTRDGVGGCSFAFTVPGVPLGQQFYGIEVSHRGRLQYTADQVKLPLSLTLGG